MKQHGIQNRFPRATFVLTHRNPADVIGSTVGLWRTLGQWQGLHRPRRDEREVWNQTCEEFRQLNRRAKAVLSKLGDDSVIRVKYERLDSSHCLTDEIQREVHSVMRRAGLRTEAQIDLSQIEDLIRERKSYRKNPQQIPASCVEAMESAAKEYAEEFEYSTRPSGG